jgi:glycosyltransferase involved in cell wall biosynthesis
MLSVIIATLDSERALVPTLAALVPGATSGLVREVVLTDGGSRDDTAAVADIAGCNFVRGEGSLGKRLKAAAASARAPWLLFLRPGSVLDTSWTGEARNFIERPPAGAQAAVFRRVSSAAPALRQIWLLLAAAIGGRPHPEQGLLIAKQFYEAIGGHTEAAADPEAELLRRIGRRRLKTLSSGVWPSR